MIQNLEIPFDKNTNQTASYEEIRTFYYHLNKMNEMAQVSDFGMTDSGHPLQVVVIDKDANFSPEQIRKAGKAIVWINNGIHPGEPDGIDATMLFVRELMTKNPNWLDNVSLVIIPVYNIDGCINRASHSRANQNGPETYGFRANAKNLDLNRDFIKCDSKNAETFNRLFNEWSPDIMIDTHTSNGADYQYTMTLIATQKDKLHPLLGDFLSQKMLPVLYDDMKADGWEMIPYVNTNGLPETGIYGFLDSPRYSSGYAALHHTISFMPETHMLKPYKDRVLSTKAFIEICIKFISENHKDLLQIRNKVKELIKIQEDFALQYALDKKKKDSILFKGYTAGYKKSLVSGQDRLYYDRNKPWEKNINYYNHYIPELTIKKPVAYVIPQAYDRIIQLMKWNGVKIETIEADTLMDVEMYRIEKYETSKSPYEGHYPHSQTKVSVFQTTKKCYKGDFLIMTNQESNRYIVETLEPQAPDSYFNWNFFDGILSQKEYYSDYVFEDSAGEILEKDQDLRHRLDQNRQMDTKFANDARAQLDFVYKNSAYYEPTYMLYPVARILNQKTN